MRIDYQEALLYPYREENRKNCILYPGFVYVVLYILIFALSGLIFAVPNAIEVIRDPYSPEYKIIMLVDYIITIPLSYLITAPHLGFSWHMLCTFQTEGFQAPAPSWIERFKDFFLDGLRLGLFYLLISSPILVLNILAQMTANSYDPVANGVSLVLSLLTLLFYVAAFFLLPFLAGPVIHSACTRSLSQLLNLKAGFALGAQHYGSVLLATVIYLVITLVYMLASVLGGCLTCCIGFLLLPFISGPMMATYCHLMAQAYRSNEPPSAPPKELPGQMS